MSSRRDRNGITSSARKAPVSDDEETKIWHFAIPVFLLIMAAGFFAASWGIDDYGTDRVSPRIFPRVFAILLGGSAVFFMLVPLLNAGGGVGIRGFVTGEKRALGSALVLFAIVVTIFFTGFYPATFLGLVLLLLIGGNRKPHVLIGAPVLILLFVFVVFDSLLQIPLPEWGGGG